MLYWMTRSRFYELMAGDIRQAMDYALRVTEALNREEQTRDRVWAIAQDPSTDTSVREQFVDGIPYVTGR